MRIAFTLVVSCFVLGCQSPTPPDAVVHVHDAIGFTVAVGSEAFACNKTFKLGTTDSTFSPQDMRFFISEVTLIGEDGAEYAYELEDDGTWQKDGVALLDFEDATGACSNGTAATNTSLRGHAATKGYHALRFTLGVPFALNHQDAASAPAPFNTTAMFWSWQGGYKFLKADGATTGLASGFNVHIGSTACQPGATPNSVAACDNPNRLTVLIENFDVETAHVQLDLGALLAGSNLDTNQPMSAPGCMSAPTDMDCQAIFARLGLPFASAPAQAQAIFSKVE